MNLYGYVENDPVNGIDPLGLSSIHVQVAVAIAKGDLVALESLLATGMLSPVAAARVQEAINRLNSPAVQSGLDKACKVANSARNAAKTTLQIAQEGGRHAGFLKNYAGKSSAELQKGIASLEKQIAEHQAKIANPEKFIPNFKQLDPRQQKALLESKWPGDIQRQQEQADILRGLLGN